MSEQMRATKFFLDRVKKLYPTFQYPDEIDVELWTDILEGHSQTDILAALKAYRRETEYNKAPNPAEFEKFLAVKSENQNMRARILKCADELGDKYGKKAWDTYLKIARQQWPNVDLSGHEWTAPVTPSADANAAGGYAEEYMQRDIKLNRCRHLLPVYQQAVRYIAEDLLAQEIPSAEWRNMDFAQRCAAAMRKGLFNRFDDVLVDVCQKYYGKDYQFDCPKPVNVAQAGYLPAHWADMDKFELSEVFNGK